MASWRVAKSLEQLRYEINSVFTRRDIGSDGAIGNQEHAARKSDHNPNAAGVVRARDFDEDLYGAGNPDGQLRMVLIAEHLRRLADYGDHRFNGHETGINGYLIYEGHIAGAGKGWKWRTYTGPNAHKHHLHVSVCGDRAGYDDTTTWHIADLFHTPPAPIVLEEDEDAMKIYVPVDMEGRAHDPATGKPWAPQMLVQGDAYTFLASEDEVKQVVAAGARVEHAQPFAVLAIKHVCTEKHR